jgi:hypothetical protein
VNERAYLELKCFACGREQRFGIPDDDVGFAFGTPKARAYDQAVSYGWTWETFTENEPDAVVVDSHSYCGRCSQLRSESKTGEPDAAS